MNNDERESEEVDVTPFEGEPDFVDSPTAQHVDDKQDVVDDADQEGSDA